MIVFHAAGNSSGFEIAVTPKSSNSLPKCALGGGAEQAKRAVVSMPALRSGVSVK